MSGQDSSNQLSVVKAQGEGALFGPGDMVAISVRFPIGHYRVPQYIRGKRAVLEAVIPTPAVNNEEEAFGRNAGMKRHYYRVAIPDISGASADRIDCKDHEIQPWEKGNPKPFSRCY